MRACVIGDLMHRSTNPLATAMAWIERALALHIAHHLLGATQSDLARAIGTSRQRVGVLIAAAEAMRDAPVFEDAMARADAAVARDP